MLGRTLGLAAVTLFMGSFAAPAAWAQAQNLEAGKSPSQLFAGTCNACHKSPRGLLKTVSAGSLPGFLRQHYTTSSDMAAQLSSFLIANGASDNRSKPGSDTKPAAVTDQVDRQGRRLHIGTPQEGARPDSEGAPLQGRKRLARPGEAPDAAKPAEGQEVPGQAASDRGPDGRKLSAKQRLSKPGKPGEEAPSAREEPPRLEPATDDKAKAETAREEDGKPEVQKPSEEGKSEAARVELPKGGSGETSSPRADPTPPVIATSPAASTAAPPTTAAAPPAVSNGLAEKATAREAAPPAPPSAVAASAPQPPAPAGPPSPPISQ